jgi:hydroxymethylbilane synthase
MKHLLPADIAAIPVHGRALPLRAGTRGSPLALVQTRAFVAMLAEACPALEQMKAFEEVVIRTTGDIVQDRKLADIGGKGLFAKEIHEQLLAGDIDFAVHSLKDLDTELPRGVAIACFLPREDPRDCLILGPGCRPQADGDPLSVLPEGAIIGTSSVRRQAQLMHRRPDLRPVTIRGNVQTRLAKIASGECHASLLALAGLRRLGLCHHADIILDPADMLPASGQGIVAVTVRADDRDLLRLFDAMSDPAAKAAAIAERALLATLDGSCHTPIGAHATLRPDGALHLIGMVARPDGSFLCRRTMTGPAHQAELLGADLGDALRAECPPDLLREFLDATGRALAGASQIGRSAPVCPA